jgi:hypothetical protein
LARFSIDELTGFYHEAIKHFGSRLAALEARLKDVSPEDQERDHLEVQGEELADLLNLAECFGVVGAFRTFETFMRNVIHRHRSKGVIKSKKKRKKKGKKEGYGELLKNQLEEIGVTPAEPPFQLKEIEKLKAIRDRIAHGIEWVESEHASELEGYIEQLKLEDGSTWRYLLKVPRGYFLEGSALVASTCKLVSEKSAEARRRPRQ